MKRRFAQPVLPLKCFRKILARARRRIRRIFRRAFRRRFAADPRGAPPRPGGPRGAGYDWERAAERALRASGYRILARNYRARSGEIDLVAEENGVLCFVEVKGRSGSGFGGPAGAVTGEKRRRVARAAAAYLRGLRGPPPPCRFDVVAILEPPGEARNVQILRDAFWLPPVRSRGRPDLPES